MRLAPSYAWEMATLLVDDEDNTRDVLREFLLRLGHKTVLEARNGEEAFALCQKEKGRIRLIISDWEMPRLDGLGLLAKVAALHELDLAPFLLITSDFPRPQSPQFKAIEHRLDGYLQKPFKMTGLNNSLREASTRRALTRDVVVHIGDQKVEIHGGHFKTIVQTKSPQDLEAVIQNQGFKIGALLVEPELYSRFGSDVLGAFKKTPFGNHTVLVCLSRDSQKISSLRVHCSFFVDEKAPTAQMTKLFEMISKRLASTSEVEALILEAKEGQRQKNFKAVQSGAQKILVLDPWNVEALNLLGDVAVQQGRVDEALENFEKSLSVNPCVPHAHIKRLELLAEKGVELKRAADMAAAFCPHSPEVLKLLDRLLSKK